MKPLKVLHKGDFNDMEQHWLNDGSVIIHLHKRRGKKHYHFRVKNLYQPNEEEVDIDTGKPIAKGSL